jgi:hypothetical protein
MASKQQQEKDKQGYEARPTPRVCVNCFHFKFDRVQTIEPSLWSKNGYWEDKNLRCGIGGFSVKKMATCNLFQIKDLKEIEL